MLVLEEVAGFGRREWYKDDGPASRYDDEHEHVAANKATGCTSERKLDRHSTNRRRCPLGASALALTKTPRQGVFPFDKATVVFGERRPTSEYDPYEQVW